MSDCLNCTPELLDRIALEATRDIREPLFEAERAFVAKLGGDLVQEYRKLSDRLNEETALIQLATAKKFCGCGVPA